MGCEPALNDLYGGTMPKTPTNPNRKRVSQSRLQLEEHLREQAGFLRRSGEAYDRGFEDEAKRLAVSVRVLVHDTNSSKSLLRQLGVKDTLRYLNTANPIDPRNLATTNNLVSIMNLPNEDGTNTIRYVPTIRSHGRISLPYRKEVSFSEWWQGSIIKDTSRRILGRKDIVLGMANQLGGAHVDPELDDEFHALVREGSLGWRLGLPPHGIVIQVPSGLASFGPPVPGGATASMRQIAFELEETLASQLVAMLGSTARSTEAPGQ